MPIAAATQRRYVAVAERYIAVAERCVAVAEWHSVRSNAHHALAVARRVAVHEQQREHDDDDRVGDEHRLRRVLLLKRRAPSQLFGKGRLRRVTQARVTRSSLHERGGAEFMARRTCRKRRRRARDER
eukprot:6213996-Pleurochrysis_carterae.AAC.2